MVVIAISTNSMEYRRTGVWNLHQSAMNCENRCVYCWRPTEFYDTLDMPEEFVDEPETIINNLLIGKEKADRRLLWQREC